MLNASTETNAARLRLKADVKNTSSVLPESTIQPSCLSGQQEQRNNAIPIVDLVSQMLYSVGYIPPTAAGNQAIAGQRVLR